MKAKVNWTPELKAEVDRRYFDEGQKPREVAEAMGLEQGPVQGMISRLRLARTPPAEVDREAAKAAWAKRIKRKRHHRTPSWQCKTPKCRGTAQPIGYCASCITASIPL